MCPRHPCKICSCQQCPKSGRDCLSRTTKHPPTGIPLQSGQGGVVVRGGNPFQVNPVGEYTQGCPQSISMCPVLSVMHRSDEEPTVTVAINDKRYAFLIDTGATKSCIREGGLWISNRSMDTQGFSGEVIRVPFTKSVEMEVGGRHIDRCLLFSPASTSEFVRKMSDGQIKYDHSFRTRWYHELFHT